MSSVALLHMYTALVFQLGPDGSVSDMLVIVAVLRVLFALSYMLHYLR